MSNMLSVMREILQEMVKEVQVMTGIHRRAMIIMIVVPVLYSLLFGGMFYQNALTKVPVLVCNLDDGTEGRQFVRDLRMISDLHVEEVALSDQDIAQRMKLDTVSGAIIIPADFSRKLHTGKLTTIELTIDNSNTVLGGTITRAVQSLVSTWEADHSAAERLVLGWNTVDASARLSLTTRVLGNSTGGYEDFFLVVLILHAAQIASVFSLGPSLVLERKRRGRKLFRDTWCCLTAKLIVYTLLELSVLSVCLAISLFCFGLTCRGSWLEITGVMTAYLLAVQAFALFMGAWVSKADKAITYALFYIMPSVLFTGAIWPRHSMDMISLFISYVIPIGYVANDVRALLVLGSASGYGLHVLCLLIYALLFLGLSVWGIKKNLGRFLYVGYPAAGNDDSAS